MNKTGVYLALMIGVFIYENRLGWSVKAAQAVDTNTSEVVLPKPASCITTGLFSQQKRITGLPTNLESGGRFFHDCEAGLIWLTAQPVQEALIVANDGTTHLVTRAETKRLSARASKLVSGIMLAMLDGNQKTIEKDFSLHVEKSSAGEKLNGIRLAPKSKRFKRALQFVHLQLNAERQIQTINIVDRRGTETQLEISALTSIEKKPGNEGCLKAFLTGKDHCELLYQGHRGQESSNKEDAQR